ncbi:hypothetical protein PYV50_15385 [Pseudomonas sp. H22_DOA]|nr:hypothetical protein PYV50_15385 [Pseudomonas sp. H22_DOA]
MKVQQESWEIKYYFPGPDLRHSGLFVVVPGAQVDSYISAFRQNWEDFEHLKSYIPAGGEFVKEGRMGMMIRIGKFSQGVCIKSYHMPISSKSHLESVISSYNHASERAKTIQKFLAHL